MGNKRVIKALFLLAVVVFNLGGGTLFTHSHKLDGQTVVHSHPFTGAASSHSHSSSSIDTISRINFGDIFAADVVALATPTATTLTTHIQLIVDECASEAQTIYLLRAPPAALV